MPGDWLAARRTEVAADRILDAAGELFAQQEAATVGMHEIASAAGCSRATLYRYFENRDALYTAYVHRESYRLYQEMTEQINSVTDPRERLIEGMMTSLMLFPGHDSDDERAMLEEFVVPIVLPLARETTG